MKKSLRKQVEELLLLPMDYQFSPSSQIIQPANPQQVPASLTPAEKKQRDKRIDEAWLRSEAGWKHRVGKGYIHKKVLGRGSFGIVGHWRYHGPDEDQRAIKDIAVKQAVRVDRGGVQKDGLTQEAKWLDLFAHSGSPHIVRKYRSVVMEEAQNTGQRFDQGMVQRMFMEFCPGGSLDGVLDSYVAL